MTLIVYIIIIDQSALSNLTFDPHNLENKAQKGNLLLKTSLREEKDFWSKKQKNQS